MRDHIRDGSRVSVDEDRRGRPKPAGRAPWSRAAHGAVHPPSRASALSPALAVDSLARLVDVRMGAYPTSYAVGPRTPRACARAPSSRPRKEPTCPRLPMSSTALAVCTCDNHASPMRGPT